MSRHYRRQRPTNGSGKSDGNGIADMGSDCAPGAGSSVRSQVLDLADHLRQEKLYVQHEKNQLRELNEQVKKSWEKLSHTAWISHQQRMNLENLTIGDGSAANCCLRANLLEQTVFQDAYKTLGFHESVYSEFLRIIHSRPKFVATCLAAGDRNGMSGMPEVISIVFSGLYGSCMLVEEEGLVLRILHHLMRAQIVGGSAGSNPRKLMRKNNCAFSRLYKSFNEQLFSAKLFLTSALYEPILCLLSDDEVFLDIDPSKAIIRFKPAEKLKKFGKEGTPEFNSRLKQHRNYICSKLEFLTKNFIRSIKESLHCFPPSVARLLGAMHSLLMSSGLAEPKEVHAVLTDAVFNLFICPAMVDPNPFGIIDTPISYTARSNLMQVAQILQVLAMWKFEDVDPRLLDLYSRFDKEEVSSIVEEMLESAKDLASTLDGDLEEDLDGQDKSQSLLVKSGVLLSRAQLQTLINYFRNFLRQVDPQELQGCDVNVEELKQLLTRLPENVPSPPSQPAPSSPSKVKKLAIAKKQVLQAKLSNVARGLSNSGSGSKLNEELNEDVNGTEGEDNVVPEPETVLVIPILDVSDTPPGFLTEDQVLSNQHSSRVVRMSVPGEDDEMVAAEDIEEDGKANILVGNSEENSSVAAGVGEKRTRFSLSHDDGSIGNTSDNLEAISEAASNRSVASGLEECEVDQTEDDAMIIDNLSDMVSANVSGRGTPNVSGRDTPSSQVTEEGEEAKDPQGSRPQQPQQAQPRNQQGRQPVQPVVVGAGPVVVGVSNAARQGNQGRKNGEPDLEEKFGRFEIKPGKGPGGVGGSEQGDETVSMVSDTWSTDVLASDTETTAGPPGGDVGLPNEAGLLLLQRQQRMAGDLGDLAGILVPTSSAGGQQAGLGQSGPFNQNRPLGLISAGPSSNLLDIAETASEAWSIDVLASDSESLRLGEVDNDDAASVARSDDTRFTDDTTRSDPEPLLDISGASGSGLGMSTGGIRREMRGAQGSLLKPSRAAAVEQWARQNNGVNIRRGSNDTNSGILKKSKESGTAGGQDESSTSKIESHLSSMSVASSTESSVGADSGISAPPVMVSAGSGAKAVAVTHMVAAGDQESSKATGAIPKSTGAIPKSISFDKAVVMMNIDQDQGGTAGISPGPTAETGEGPKHKSRDKSFLKGFKFPKIGRRGGHGGHSHNKKPEDDEKAPPDESQAEAEMNISSDDILAKYRTKFHQENGLSNSGEVILSHRSFDDNDGILVDLSSDPPAAQASTGADSYAFQDAKRKLRLMLSEADLTLLAELPPSTAARSNDLMWLLKVQLAESLNLQDRSHVAKLYETIRCLSLFDEEGCRQLVKSMRSDYRKRAPYLSYLVRSRQGLLSSLSYQERLLNRYEEDKSVCSSCLVSACVRMFLERKEKQVAQFVSQFKECQAADEKTNLMERFLDKLWTQLEADPSSIWTFSTSEAMMDLCKHTVERTVVSHIYLFALYPNGEADISRDEVLTSHIKRLANVLTPNHKDLRIHSRFHYEQPWPSAQAEIRRLAAYKTPQEKVGCVIRCSQTIMNLLSLASKSSVPAADDFVPVMVFVIVMANPPNLLSTVQYVESFYGSRMCGEDQYWWTQFVSAIEFIKTMDYK